MMFVEYRSVLRVSAVRRATALFYKYLLFLRWYSLGENVFTSDTGQYVEQLVKMRAVLATCFCWDDLRSLVKKPRLSPRF